MKFSLYILLLLFMMSLDAQSLEKNAVFIQDGIMNLDEPEQKRDGFLFAFYKNHISKQILNDCIYDHSCSQFSHDVFENFGLFKGLFLTADRLTRCNRAAFAEMPSSSIDSLYRAIDHWDFYEKIK